MSDLFFGGAYEAVMRLLKKPKFAMFGEGDDILSGVEKGDVPLNIGEDS